MNIASLGFVYFLIAALTIYYLLPRRPQNIWLLLLSYAFCISWAWQFALILVLVTAVNYGLAHRVRLGEKKQRGWLWVGIGFNIGLLLVFRQFDFFVPETRQWLATYGWPTAVTEDTLTLLLPIGLSYYVLELISYLVDVYRGQLKAVTDLLDFALYLAYFPKLIAGPIERASTFLPKLAQPRLVDNEQLARSFSLITIGLVRKLVFADSLLGTIPWDVFSQPDNLGGIELWGWLIVYALALYNDFAGYTNLVCGISGLFGIELSANFKQPYFARNITEFWNRWHITLSHWLRDYIFFPLSRTLLRRNPGRANVPNLIIPPLATMLVSGLWHGLSIHMLVWGILHGLFQIAERLPSLWRPIVPIQRQPRWRQIGGIIITFLFVCLAWVAFRMELPVAIAFWRSLLNITDFSIKYQRLLIVLPFTIPMVTLDWLQYVTEDELFFRRWPQLAQAFVYATACVLILIVSQGEQDAPFVYQLF